MLIDAVKASLSFYISLVCLIIIIMTKIALVDLLSIALTLGSVT